MYKYLHQFASARFFYERTQSWLLLLGIGAALCLSIGIYWGLFIAPADYQQGDAFRIIYLHVPAAFLSISLYVFMSLLAILLIVWRIKIAGLMINIVAQIGAVMTFLALLTGSIWGKPMWGTWWIWDARLTAELILLLIYVAILAVKQSFNNYVQGDKIIAILTLVGLVDLPIIHYSVYWWNTLHQGATIALFAKPKIAIVMLYPLIINILGFLLYTVWLIIYHTNIMLLLHESKQRWVKTIIRNKLHG